MRVPHRHFNIFMAHKLLEFLQRNLARLRQPRSKRMSECMKCDRIQSVPIIRGKGELLDCRPETGGSLGEGCSFLRSLKNGLTRLAAIGLQHGYHISRNTDKDALPTLLDDVKATGVVVHILPAQLENLRGAEAGLEREQAHIVQLMMPEFQVSQQSFCLVTGKETQTLVVDLCHLPDATSRGERIAAAPEFGCNGVIDGGTHEAENVVDGLGSQQLGLFGLILLGGDPRRLSRLGVSGRGIQQFSFERGKQIGVQIDNGRCMDSVPEMGVVLTVMLIDILPFTSSPLNVGIQGLSDSHLTLRDGIDASTAKSDKKFYSFISCHFRATSITLFPNGFPMALACGIRVPECVDAIRFTGPRITLGRVAIEHAFVLCFYVFSASYVAHEETVASNSEESNMLIQNLSKMEFQKNIYQTNILILFYFLCVTLGVCDRERERERELCFPNRYWTKEFSPSFKGLYACSVLA